MKTKNLLRKIVSAGFLLTLVIIVVMSCKKKDDEPIPPSPPVPPSPLMSDVFQNKPIKLMSDYEIANNRDFPGHVINQLGNGIAGGEDPEIPNPLKKAGKTLWEIYDYKHTEMRFDQIDKGINQIEAQITQLQTDLTILAGQLSLDITDLTNIMYSTTMNEYITDINNAMDSTLPNTGFGWFTSAGRKYQAGGTATQFQKDTVGLGLFAYNIMYGVDNFDVIGYYTQMNALMCPPNGGSQTNSMTTFANYIIQNTASLGLTDSASMMTCYMVYENYFMQAINYQFQCALMYTNARNYFDSTGSDANVFYTGTFTKDIKQEVAAFLSTVEYLAINLSDYRHFVKMEADYPYNQSGLAPDFLFPHVLARSQFIANLLYDALGLSYPVMCGTIITPNQYSNEYGSVVDSIALSVNGKQLTSTANVLPSQYPYTYWNISNSTCYPDNQWNVYRFGKMGVGDPGWPTTAVTITVMDNGGYYPWSHYQPCKGNVTTLYYNPQNPTQTSTSYTPTCNIQFGYFAARWNWGYQFITMRSGYFLRPNSLDYMHENSTLACDYHKQFVPPGAVTTDGNGWVYENSTTQGFSWEHDNLGNFSFSNNTVSTDHYYIVADVLYCDVSTSSEVPTTSGGIEMWGMSNTQYTGQDGLMTTYLGSTLTSTSNNCGYNSYRSSGDIVKTQFGNSGIWGIGISSVYISAGKSYQPSAEVYYQAYGVGTVPIAFSNYNMMQIVYDGTYNIFQ